MNLLWTRRARDDLVEIALYIARDKPVAALNWIDWLEQRARKISDGPMNYRIVPEFQRADIREMITGNYRTVFKVEADRVVILTVFEGHKELDLDPDEAPDLDAE